MNIEIIYILNESQICNWFKLLNESQGRASPTRRARLRGGRSWRRAAASQNGLSSVQWCWQHRAAQSPGSGLTQGVLGGEFPEPSNAKFWLVEARDTTDGYAVVYTVLKRFNSVALAKNFREHNWAK